MVEYNFTKTTLDISLLRVQINASVDISQDTTGLTWNAPDGLKVFFDSELTSPEQAILTAIIEIHDAAEGGHYNAVHKLTTQIPGNLTNEKWYQDIDESNILSNLAKEIVYTYSGQKVMSRTEKIYFKGGVVAEEKTIQYWADTSAKKLLEKDVS